MLFAGPAYSSLEGDSTLDSHKLLTEKVCIITGGGNGIGKETALQFARLGAQLVINDLGANTSGDDSNPGVVNLVVDEINKAGGEAVANTDSVTEPKTGERLIEQALDTYGKVDVVVNNAGNVRFAPFDEMSVDDFDSLIRVHLYGSFYVARAAAPHFRNQRAGSYVHMSSAAGMIGNRGASNYAAAKSGIAAMSKGIALDMAQYGVRSNCIAPSAYGRMAEAVDQKRRETFTSGQELPSLKSRQGRIEQVVPLVAYLASDLSKDVNGQVFGIRANEIYLYSQPRPIRALHRNGGWTAEGLAVISSSWQSAFAPLETYQDVFNWDPIH
jgi:NAD(P)-dependent dehydrogenase (short-subunit alcohol dehydrogenase family)